jgi:hypothetical protein
VNLITENWRLKLLAVGLSVLMLGAVAFSQNPPTVKTIRDVSIAYTVPTGLVLINPPSTTTVTVQGLADTLTSMSNASVSATIDVSKAAPGPNVNVPMHVRSLVAQVTVQSQVVPTILNIDQMQEVKLPVVVRAREAQGWQITKALSMCPPQDPPCQVTYNGPAGWETNLKAYADFPGFVQNGTSDVLTQPVVLVPSPPQNTIPSSGLDIDTVSIHIEAKTGTTSRQAVLIDSPPSHGPPPGYRITGLSIDPATVVITGAPDLTNRTSDATFRVTIPYPDGVAGAVKTATVVYSISANPNTQPTPSP